MMNRIVASRITVILVILTGFFTRLEGDGFTANQRTHSCAAAEFRQFDFWIGDWNVFEVNRPDAAVAHVRVDRILDGCVLREDYQDNEGLKGQSFSVYDSSKRVWHQSWVTNHGRLLLLDGNLQSGSMVLEGADRAPEGKLRQNRGIWKIEGTGVRETGVTSLDGGKTWQPWFDLMFQPHQSGTASVDGDKQEVLALDREYQAAVKINDWKTMDRLLADDFILSTSSGKVYNKADLVKEAKAGKVKYEHQEDSDQTVRVWGDTAVITAKLWEKGTDDGREFEYRVIFSDTYVRTPEGWRYVFGQSSRLPATSN